MKRFHVHVSVADLDESVKFYSTLFGNEPTVIKDDYAKWLLDDPRVNFAISAGASHAAIDHLGFQVESDDELGEVTERLAAAGAAVTRQENATCCYARGNKGWVDDPSGISWETFHTLEASAVRGDDIVERPAAIGAGTSCCTPQADASACCGAAKGE